MNGILEINTRCLNHKSRFDPNSAPQHTPNLKPRVLETLVVPFWSENRGFICYQARKRAISKKASLYILLAEEFSSKTLNGRRI